MTNRVDPGGISASRSAVQMRALEACTKFLFADPFSAVTATRALLFIVCIMFSFILLAVAGLADAAALDRRQDSSSSSTVPQWFQTTPELFAGEQSHA